MLHFLGILFGIAVGVVGTLSWQKLVSYAKAEETKGIAALKADVTSLTSKF